MGLSRPGLCVAICFWMACRLTPCPRFTVSSVIAVFTASKYFEVRDGEAGEAERALGAAGFATLGTGLAFAFGTGLGAAFAARGLVAGLGAAFAAGLEVLAVGLGFAAGFAAGFGLAGVRERERVSGAASAVVASGVAEEPLSAAAATTSAAAGASTRCDARDGRPRGLGEATGEDTASGAGAAAAGAAEVAAASELVASAGRLPAWPTCSNS